MCSSLGTARYRPATEPWPPFEVIDGWLEEAFKAGAEWANARMGIESVPGRRGARRHSEDALAQAARKFATS